MWLAIAQRGGADHEVKKFVDLVVVKVTLEIPVPVRAQSEHEPLRAQCSERRVNVGEHGEPARVPDLLNLIKQAREIRLAYLVLIKQERQPISLPPSIHLLILEMLDMFERMVIQPPKVTISVG